MYARETGGQEGIEAERFSDGDPAMGRQGVGGDDGGGYRRCRRKHVQETEKCTEMEMELEMERETETEAKMETETEEQTETEMEPDTNLGTETETRSEMETEPGPETETVTDTATASEMGFRAPPRPSLPHTSIFPSTP